MNRKMLGTTTSRLLLVAITISLGSHCSAAMFSVERITANGSENPESQISVDVSDSGGRVLFKLSNAGPIASNITEIYWDDDTTVLSNGPDIDAGTTSAGANFIANAAANPGNLPAGNTISLSADFSIDSDDGPAQGINPGEMAGFLFDGNANSVIAAMNAGSLRVGMHVRSIGNGDESESFVSVPEPTTLAMLTLGLFGLASRRKHCQ